MQNENLIISTNQGRLKKKGNNKSFMNNKQASFKSNFDELGISRKVLSRSLEDTGTMLESIVPWTPTALFIVPTLGVPVADYWHWQFLSLINFIIAPALAITGIGCFYKQKKS
ncbi:MAG: hypothetical protein H8D58_03090 [Candidatus Marinimicrobia bacterium]|nr:hypothetical protein [Candidatus Neomarinimicrobiota bacterium]